MGCPRCSGSLAAYTFDERESVLCEECGWVGIETTLQAEETGGQAESWTEAMEREADREVTTDRSSVGLPPVVMPDSPMEAKESDQGTESRRQESGNADDSPLVEQIDGLEPDAAEQLVAAGIETLRELARADAGALTSKTALAESTLQSYSRKAAIHLVTAPEENPPASMDSTED